MNQKRKGKYIGLARAPLVHAVVIALLIPVEFTLPEQSKEGGVPVMVGGVPDVWGVTDPSLMEVDVMPEKTVPEMPEEVERDVLAQEEEETVATKPRAEERKEKAKEPEKTAAEKVEEAGKLAAGKMGRERRVVGEAARKRVAGAPGKGVQMGSRDTTEGKSAQGNPTGSSPSGVTAGTEGCGIFNPGGRSIRGGGLPHPVYNMQDEGKVVATITASPAGQITATSINRQTNTVNPALREAAEDTAKKIRFNTVSGSDNQTGTITYYFNLK